MSHIAHPPGGHRRLSSDQRSALLQVPQRVPAAAAPREFLAHLVSLIGRVLETKAAVAGKHEGAWVVAVESAPTPSLSHLHNGGSHAFDSVGLTLGARATCFAFHTPSLPLRLALPVQRPHKDIFIS